MFHVCRTRPLLTSCCRGWSGPCVTPLRKRRKSLWSKSPTSMRCVCFHFRRLLCPAFHHSASLNSFVVCSGLRRDQKQADLPEGGSEQNRMPPHLPSGRRGDVPQYYPYQPPAGEKETRLHGFKYVEIYRIGLLRFAFFLYLAIGNGG